MNPRVEVKTDDERRADALAYYYRNRERILAKKKAKRDAEKRKVIPQFFFIYQAKEAR